ncbi:MAG: Pyruvate ferredoxin/flavodoxin oxidoreductase, delta subunit [Candidatus Moranbacteria bacterium GW2011_GWE2_36_40]|nr:MAG: Pyruvate ferredoxin/flavodoxin oxidoreductase, delta subunit [Candidatus Moranbacteria bacterium GW2011_GWE2_36_40]
MERGGIIKHDISKSPKTGDWAYSKPVVDKDKCIGCETCVQYCPDACIEMRTYNSQLTTDNKKQKKVADIDYDFCKGCGVCAQVCPVKAIIMKK